MNFPIYSRDDFFNLHQIDVPIAEIIEASTILATEDYYGPVQSGYLRISGHLKKSQPVTHYYWDRKKYYDSFDQGAGFMLYNGPREKAYHFALHYIPPGHSTDFWGRDNEGVIGLILVRADEISDNYRRKTISACAHELARSSCYLTPWKYNQ